MALISNDIIIEPDLKIKDGDIAVEKADDINIQYLTYGDAGQFRKAPTLGVGITSFLNAPTQDGRNIRKKIRQELEKDGYLLKQLDSSENKNGGTDIEIKANKITVKL
jgi:hypothetical protein